ncbi:hypothetical protein [Sorangium sp. So ce131]|uniref:hypothetical protein n=1 Tax=Sorangium sp. So ce131 TaxID=3133282 RepID=UPI003F5ED44D
MSAADLVVAREYLHVPSAGKAEQGAALYPAVEGFLSARYTEGAIEGYNLIFLASAEQCAEELVDDDWKKLVPERYPVLYVFVQPSSGGDVVFDAFLKAEGFVRVK